MTLREAHPPVEALEVFESIVFFLAVLYILQQECRMTLREAQAPCLGSPPSPSGIMRKPKRPHRNPARGRAQNNDDQHHGKHQQDEHHLRFHGTGEDHHHGSQDATNMTLVQTIAITKTNTVMIFSFLFLDQRGL